MWLAQLARSCPYPYGAAVIPWMVVGDAKRASRSCVKPCESVTLDCLERKASSGSTPAMTKVPTGMEWLMTEL